MKARAGTVSLFVALPDPPTHSLEKHTSGRTGHSQGLPVEHATAHTGYFTNSRDTNFSFLIRGQHFKKNFSFRDSQANIEAACFTSNKQQRKHKNGQRWWQYGRSGGRYDKRIHKRRGVPTLFLSSSQGELLCSLIPPKISLPTAVLCMSVKLSAVKNTRPVSFGIFKKPRWQRVLFRLWTLVILSLLKSHYKQKV